MWGVKSANYVVSRAWLIITKWQLSSVAKRLPRKDEMPHFWGISGVWRGLVDGLWAFGEFWLCESVGRFVDLWDGRNGFATIENPHALFVESTGCR